MENEQFLSIPENRDLVELASRQVLKEVAPAEAEEIADLIGEIVDKVAKDQVKVNGTPGHESGGFGSDDLIGTVVVPIVVDVLKGLLVTLGKNTLSELKAAFEAKPADDAAKLIKVQAGQVIVYHVDQSRSSKARTKIKEIGESVTRTLMSLLRNGK